MPRKLKEPVFDDDNPEWTEEDFARATYFDPPIKVKDLTPEMLARIRRGPQKAPTKVAVSIRLSPRSRPARNAAASLFRARALSPMCQVPWPSTGTCSPEGREVVRTACGMRGLA